MIKTALLLILLFTAQPFSHSYGRCPLNRQIQCHERLFAPRHTNYPHVRLPPTPPQYIDTKLLVLQFIDSGATSEVFLTYDLISQTYYAAKRYFNYTHNPFYNSAIKILGIDTKWMKDPIYKNDIELFEYKNGTSWRSLNLSSFELKVVLLKIISRLKTAHQMGFIHMDIKPKNILVSKLDVQIIDWSGVTTYYLGQKMDYRYGTGCYMAPQLLMNQQYYTSAVDVWSLGISTYVVLVGRKPYRVDCGEQPLMALIDLVGYDAAVTYYNKYKPYKEIDIVLTLEAYRGHTGVMEEKLEHIKGEEERELVRTMLIVDPEDRPSMAELMDNQYFRKSFVFPKPYEQRRRQRKKSREQPSNI